MSTDGPAKLKTGATDGRTASAAAVIDIGTTQIRMAIAQIGSDGEIQILERLSQAVNLGKDTFSKGVIRKSTIEECVRVLKSYRQLLVEYQILQPHQIRVVATSAVREALNRLAFIDRVYIATGIEIELIDEAEVNRITYLGIKPFLESEPELSSGCTVVIEVGGGNTELLLVEKGDVVFSHTYRLGSLRLREMLQAYNTPKSQARTILDSQVQRIVDQMVTHISQQGGVKLMTLGGDMRFAASCLIADWDSKHMGHIPTKKLEHFTNHILSWTEDQLIQKYHLTFPDAETLGPSLLAYLLLAKALNLDEVLVTNVNLRDGLLKEMVIRDTWSEDFTRQVSRSAIELGRKFNFDETHARHVAELSVTLFDALKDEHHLEQQYRRLLYVAALLHEIGQYVSSRSYHKHSMYLIRNSEIFGLSRHQILLVALVARYHRRSSPRSTHEGYLSLDRDSRVAIAKMAALLRVADALDRSYSQRVNDLRCRREDSRLVISVPRVEDLSLEQLALKQKGALFEETFGMTVLLRKSRR
ncbi:MAG: HD domain-containing protein [Planctomycetaceae bacterium]